jgi:hypothetical protein
VAVLCNMRTPHTLWRISLNPYKTHDKDLCRPQFWAGTAHDMTILVSNIPIERDYRESNITFQLLDYAGDPRCAATAAGVDDLFRISNRHDCVFLP